MPCRRKGEDNRDNSKLNFLRIFTEGPGGWWISGEVTEKMK